MFPFPTLGLVLLREYSAEGLRPGSVSAPLEEFVDRMVELQHSLLRSRTQTSSWHLEWPGRLAGLLKESEAPKVLAELRDDHAAYMEASHQEVVFWKRLTSRNIMGQARMRQFVGLAEAAGWVPSESLRRLAMLTFSGITGTKIVEDANKLQRTAESSKNFSKKLE